MQAPKTNRPTLHNDAPFQLHVRDPESQKIIKFDVKPLGACSVQTSWGGDIMNVYQVRLAQDDRAITVDTVPNPPQQRA